MSIAPELTQFLITAGAVLGIVVIGLLAIVPTMMEMPSPGRHRTSVQPDEAGRPEPVAVGRPQPERPVRLASSVS